MRLSGSSENEPGNAAAFRFIRAGADAVRRIVEAAPAAGIDLLTLYAFSSDNWKRPTVEVEALMSLFQRFLSAETAVFQMRRDMHDRGGTWACVVRWDGLSWKPNCQQTLIWAR